MKKIVIGLIFAAASMSASAVQCVVHMKNGTSYIRNQTNCVTTQHAGMLPTKKLLRNAVILVGAIYLTTALIDKKKADSLKNSFLGEDDGPIEYVAFEDGERADVKPAEPLTKPAQPYCAPGLFGRYEGDRWVCN